MDNLHGHQNNILTTTKKELERERSKKNRNNIKNVICEISSLIGTQKLNQNRSLSVAVSLLTLNTFHRDKSGLQFLNKHRDSKTNHSGSGIYDDGTFIFYSPAPTGAEGVKIISILDAINSVAVAFTSSGSILYESSNLIQVVGLKATVIAENINVMFYNSNCILKNIFELSRFMVLCKIKFGKREETRNGFHVMKGRILENESGQRIYLGYIKLKCSISTKPGTPFPHRGNCCFRNNVRVYFRQVLPHGSATRI